MKILTLNLNKEYFDEILSGNKKEEYREVKEYWTKRLKQKYGGIVIKCGYPKSEDVSKEIWFEWNGFIKKKINHKHFGSKEVEVYAIDLNKKIENPKIAKIRKCIKNDLKYFPEIESWFSSILGNKDYIVKVYEDFYYILRKSKNKICRVEKFNNNANLSDILEKIRLELENPISVIVPIDKDDVVISFKNNGFKIKKHLLNKYMEGRNCYFMMEG